MTTNEETIKRMNHPLYIEWLLAGRGLLTVKSCLGQICETIVDQWHLEVKEKLKTKWHEEVKASLGSLEPGEAKNGQEYGELLKAVSSCSKGCTAKDIHKVEKPQKQTKKNKNAAEVTQNSEENDVRDLYKFISKCTHCTDWLQEILGQLDLHTWNITKGWLNTQVQMWPSNSWQLALPFTMAGSESCHTAMTSDITCLLHVFRHCKKFSCVYSKKSMDISKNILKLRNKIMHQPDLELETQTRKEFLGDMISFLSELNDGQKNQLAEESIEELEKLLALDIRRIQINKVIDYEEDFWNNALNIMNRSEIKEMQDTLNALVQKFSEFRTILERVNSNPQVVNLNQIKMQININNNYFGQKFPSSKGSSEDSNQGAADGMTLARRSDPSSGLETMATTLLDALPSVDNNCTDLPQLEGEDEEDQIKLLEKYCDERRFSPPLYKYISGDGPYKAYVGMKVTLSIPAQDVKRLKRRRKMAAQHALAKLGIQEEESFAKDKLSEYVRKDYARIFGETHDTPQYDVEGGSEFIVTFLAFTEACSVISREEAQRFAAIKMSKII